MNKFLELLVLFALCLILLTNVCLAQTYECNAGKDGSTLAKTYDSVILKLPQIVKSDLTKAKTTSLKTKYTKALSILNKNAKQSGVLVLSLTNLSPITCPVPCTTSSLVEFKAELKARVLKLSNLIYETLEILFNNRTISRRQVLKKIAKIQATYLEGVAGVDNYPEAIESCSL